MTLEALARELGVTARFIQHAGRVRGAMAVDAHMRRRGTAQATIWKRLEARLNMYRMHASLLAEEVRIRSEQRIPTFDPVDTRPDDAATGANAVGHARRPGTEPDRLDRGRGLSCGRGGLRHHPRRRHVAVGQRHPADLHQHRGAHRPQAPDAGQPVGHLVLHANEVTEDVEDQANTFAAELLMPIEVIRPQLRGLRVDALFDLKREWGVSMGPLIERAYRSGLLTATQRTSMWKMLSARGWRTREPLSDELAPEHPQLTGHIAAALAQRGLASEEVAKIAGFATPEDNRLLPAAGANGSGSSSPAPCCLLV